MIRINKYQRLIAEYEKRREEVRAKFPAYNRHHNPEYQKAVKVIAQRLYKWRTTLKWVRSVYKKYDDAAKLVCEYFDYDITEDNNPLLNCYKKRNMRNTQSDKLFLLAKNIFIKYCAENIRHEMMFIDDYMGKVKPKVFSSGKRNKNGSICGTVRKRFTASFATNNYNRQQYHNFLQFVKEKQNEQRKVA